MTTDQLNEYTVAGVEAYTEQGDKLKQQYEEVCNKYVAEFCRKQEVDFEGWVADTVGGVAWFGDRLFNFQDIVLDVNSCQPKGVIFNWYYDSLDNPVKAINYFSYTKGLRADDVD